MRISDFDYDLPEELIAQSPLPDRDASRMLVLDRNTQRWTDSTFHSFIDYLRPEDVVVINNTRVIPARLIGRRRGTQGRVEVFLIRKLADDTWQALLRPGARLKKDVVVDFGKRLCAQIADDPGQEVRHVRFVYDGSFDDLLAEVGSTPLPPYIKRPIERNEDRDRYQTVYAREAGAIAAPTAGLHFTADAIKDVRRKARLAEITLHVGYGTFEPVRAEQLEQHSVSSEAFEIGEEAAELINSAKQRGGRIIAVGTTTVRALESSADAHGHIVAQHGEATLTIIPGTPGFSFRIVDALLTNFHLPRSSLLLLVSAFAGKDLILAAYKHAVDECYRFYSYGDCMLIL